MAAAGKKVSVTLSYFSMEVNKLAVEEAPRWPRLRGRKLFGWEDGEESRRKLGGRRFSNS